MMCALGIAMALYEVQRGGKGQVIDSAMVDGSTYLTTFIYSLYAQGVWSKDRGTNSLDSGASNYEVYKTKDGKYMSVGALEPQFYALLLKGLELDPERIPANTPDNWGELKKLFAAKFATKTRGEWEAVFAGKDACVAPVLEMDEVAEHPHSKARGLFFTDGNGVLQPAPAPKMSVTPAFTSPRPFTEPGQHSFQVLMEYGFLPKQIQAFIDSGTIWAPPPKSSL